MSDAGPITTRKRANRLGMYLSLRAYPCRCTYKRAGKQPLWHEGDRVLEQRCSRCIQLSEFELIYPDEVPTPSTFLETLRD